jgi:CxxC motif-containing protein
MTGVTCDRSSTYIFVGTVPTFSALDDTSFLAPVEIGDVLLRNLVHLQRDIKTKS